MSCTDWARSERSYAGWVPNIGSHLSFSMIGSGRGTRVARFSGAHREPVGRAICVLERRQTDDFLAARFWKRLFEPAVSQHWLLTGMSQPVEAPVDTIVEQVVEADGTRKAIPVVRTAPDDQGMLVGRVHVIPESPDCAGRRRENKVLATLRKTLRTAKLDGKAALETFIASVEADVRREFPGCVGLRFALMRTGEIRFWYDEAVPDLTDVHHEVIARQAYYFIKDMVHRHVHHEEASDQITPLTRFDTSSAETQARDEEDWRRQTMWSLSREAEKQGSRKKLNRLREALGIIAYADAFQKTLMPYIRDAQDPTRFVPKLSAYGFDFSHVRESTKVQVDQLASKRTATAPFIAASVAGAIAVLALLSSIVSTRNGEVRAAQAANRQGPPPLHLAIPDWLLNFFASQPFAAALFVIAALYWLFATLLGDVFLSNGYKPRQGLHGASISLALRFGLSSRWAYAFLNIFYGLAALAQIGLFLVVARMLKT